MMINIDDFRYMWRGKPVRILRKQEEYLLAPVDRRKTGTDRALLLLHGFSSSPAVYREFIPQLVHYDAIVCPTLPGHAATIDAFANVKAREWVIAAELACDALMQTYKAVDVMGLSLGGVLAYHLSHRFQLHHLYLLAPAFALQLNTRLAIAAARVLRCLGFNYIRNRAGNLHMHLHDELAYRQLPLTTIIELLTFLQNIPFKPPTCPTDLFLGYFDEVVDSVKVAHLFANVPNTKTHWLDNSAHALPLDGDIATILACLR